MSSDVTKALYARLAGIETLTGRFLAAQQQIAALLGTDADTGKPAIYFANKDTSSKPKDAQGTLLPVVTFRPSPGTIDGRFADGMAVENSLYDMEIWEYSGSSTLITDIGEALQILLDGRRGAPVLPSASGQVFWAETFVPLAVLYDQNSNGWFGLVRWKFIEGRA